MDYRSVLGIVSVILQICCILPYFVGIFKGRIKPHGFTWFLWGTLCGISLCVQLYEKAGAGAWLSMINTVAPLSVAALAFRYGTFTATRSDWVVLVIALLALPLWVFTQNPLWSVLIVCGINILATIPTLRKTWLKPHEEYPFTFFVGGIAAFLSIAAMDHLRVTVFLYPLVIAVSNMILVALILYRRTIVKI